ncbi:hypothetical protein [Tsukamurella paurometabola]|uniref:hypothetical protein n=1 Tax=Tsukamurella paurometabola TaxID=2061 RepID=UPI0002F7500D|nr:hypothetical protein [Tsukamurella paurometabola]
MASPSDPSTGRAGDTEQFPVARTGAHAAVEPADAAPTDGPAHAVGSDSGSGISRAGWWAITIAAAVLLILGFLLTFGPARYWTPVPVVFLGYFLISGLIGLVFWKGVRELRDSNPTLHSGDGPASPGARIAAAIGAVGIASALVLLPAGLSDAPANAAPCPDGTNTCGPQPTMGPQPTQGNGGNTTAPQAPNTTVPGYTAPDTPPQQGSGSTPTVQGQVPTMPTGDTPSNGCIFNCGPTQAPQTGQPTAPQNGQNPVTTAPNTPATTPQAPTTTPRLRTPTPETTTSTTSSKARDRDDDQQRSSDEDRDKNSGIPYQAAEIAALAGTYRRKKTSDAVRGGQVVSEYATRTLYTNATAVSKPVQGTPTPTPGPDDGGWTGNPGKGPDSRWRLTAEQVQKIMPNASRKNIDKYLPYLNELVTAIDGWENKKRTAALLAMITVETGSLGSMNELEPPAALGNYFGRGFIQLTGTWSGGPGNYASAQEALGLPLVSNPALAADPRNSVAITAWFWQHNPTLGGVNLNSFADKMTNASDLASVTRGIFGSVDYSELVAKAAETQREAAWTRAMGVL